MADELKTLSAGRYTLVARVVDETPKGAIWADKAIVFKCDGQSIDDVWQQLSDQLYALLAGAAASRGGREPSAEDAAVAFKKLWEHITDGQRAMLRAHFNAPKRRMTATQLANAAGYKNHSAANLQYGLLGLRLFAEMPEELPTRKDGTPVMTCAIATGAWPDPDAPEHEWVWEMRPHIAAGLRRAGVL